MNNFKFLRKKANISQTELSNLINVSQSTVAMWESGSSFPRSDKLPILANLLHCSINDLFKEREESANESN